MSMLAVLLLFLFLGILVGTLTGLFPGIHINLVGAGIFALSLSILSKVNALNLVVFIVAMSIAHIFLDFIPSIFLGAPSDGTELSILPGHEMLSKGLGIQAVYLASLGCLYGIFIFLTLVFPISLFAKKFYDFLLVSRSVPLGLVLISASLIIFEKEKMKSLLVFVLTGILGLIVLNSQMREPLLPLLSGLFGASGILLSVQMKTKVPKQNIEAKIKIKKLKPLITSAIFSPLSMFFPALSSGQIAVIGNKFLSLEREGFLFMLGAINTLAMSFSFLGLFLISKTRTGSAVVIKSLISDMNWNTFLLLLLVILFSGTISFFTTNWASKRFAYVLEKVDYTKISILTLIIISLIAFFVSGFFGLFVLTISALTGIYCISSGVNRINMMGCLLLPTIVLYLLGA